jgi:hypothetical protein
MHLATTTMLVFVVLVVLVVEADAVWAQAFECWAQFARVDLLPLPFDRVLGAQGELPKHHGPRIECLDPFGE